VVDVEKRVSTPHTIELIAIFVEFKCKYFSNDEKVPTSSGTKKFHLAYYQVSLPELPTSHQKFRADFPQNAFVDRTSIPQSQISGLVRWDHLSVISTDRVLAFAIDIRESRSLRARANLTVAWINNGG